MRMVVMVFAMPVPMRMLRGRMLVPVPMAFREENRVREEHDGEGEALCGRE